MSRTGTWVAPSLPNEKTLVRELSQTEDDMDMHIQKFNWKSVDEESETGQLIIEYKHKSYTYDAATFEIHLYDGVPHQIYDALCTAVDNNQHLEPIVKNRLVDNEEISEPLIK